MYGFIVIWIDCTGNHYDEWFEYRNDADQFADTLRPDHRGTVRVIDEFIGDIAGKEYCGIVI